MSECLFCKIVAGEIPANVIRKNDRMLAFTDINPQAPTHVLVIPTQHIATVNDARDSRLLGDLLLFARDIAREKGVADGGYRLVINTNTDGGQSVYHVHVHLLGGRKLTWPPG
jgi:histidine triad (HIT) family protein